MRKSLPPMLLALALCLGACSARAGDWKLATDGLRAEELDGKTWYDIGGDLLARRSDPEDENSGVLVLIGESHGVPEEIDFEKVQALAVVSDKIFLRLCDRGESEMPRPNFGTFKRENSFVREYRTRSNRVAKVEIDLGEGLAEVTIQP